MVCFCNVFMLVRVWLTVCVVLYCVMLNGLLFCVCLCVCVGLGFNVCGLVVSLCVLLYGVCFVCVVCLCDV